MDLHSGKQTTNSKTSEPKPTHKREQTRESPNFSGSDQSVATFSGGSHVVQLKNSVCAPSRGPTGSRLLSLSKKSKVSTVDTLIANLRSHLLPNGRTSTVRPLPLTVSSVLRFLSCASGPQAFRAVPSHPVRPVSIGVSSMGVPGTLTPMSGVAEIVGS